MNSLPLFHTEPFINALKAFFAELKVPLNYVADEPTTAKEILKDTYKGNDTFQLMDDVYFVGMVDDAAFEGKKSLEANKIKSDYDGILIFGVTLKSRPNGLLPTRSQLAEITRAFNRTFPYTPVTIIFKYAHYICIANAERFTYKINKEGEKIGKVSLLKDVDVLNTHAGHKRILNQLAVDAIRAYDKKNKVQSFADLYKGWQKVFNTQILNEQFYKDYQALSVKLIRAIYPLQMPDKLKAHQGALNLLNRLMFIYFIQKKNWLMQDTEFMFHFWQDYQTSNNPKDTFHEKWLNKVFFKAFNGKAYKDPDIFKTFPQKYHTAIVEFPYLNGGLFTPADEDNFLLNDEIFEQIFNYLQGYIFTISEDTPDEINLEINPELLGKMYEGMINATDLNDVDAENGIVYTERPEINFMTRRSMVEVLHKKLPTLSRQFLYHFCFDKPNDKTELLRKFKVNAEELRKAVISTTALDPSCGSGSMLIGLIQLQVELIKALDDFAGKAHSPKDDFNLKKQIISECIYGVDVKEWAVRIAELRFWLYMVADAEFSTQELTQKPLLPNLDFKLRQGNSLLQQIGNLDFSVKGLFKGRKKNAGATRKLNEFIKKKKEFITNQAETDTNYKKLKEEELFVFKTFINEMIEENKAEIKKLKKGSTTTADIFGNAEHSTIPSKKITELETENDQFQKILANIKNTGRLPFSYDIDFMEIFLTAEDAGFDLIIGNPPYVRQEDILPADDAQELERLLKPENKTEKAQINKNYKAKLTQKVYQTFPFLDTKLKTIIDGKNKTIPLYGDKVPGRSDLYVYFQLLMPALLNTKGTFCFIISNSWLDVEFGGYVQQFLLKHTQLHAIYDCNVRSFSASVNTIIYLHSAIINDKLDDKLKTFKPQGKPIKFVMNKADYTEMAYTPFLIEQEHCTQNTFNDLYRVIVKTPQELWEEGFDEIEYNYQSNKWGGKYLRAPEIYFTILQKGKDKLVPLKEVAEVRFGIKTGANEFFILDRKKAQEWGIEEEFLVPIVKSSRDVKALSNSKNNINDYLFFIKDAKQKLSQNVLKYIQFGEDSTQWEDNPPANRNSCQGRIKWYVIGERRLPDISCNYMIDTMMRFFDYESLVVDNFQELHLIKKEQKEKALYTLNSTLFSLLLNIIGRGNFGDGLMKLQTFEVADLLTFNPELLPNYSDKNFIKREHLSLYLELGFDKTQPIRSQVPNPLPDRKALDDIIFDELGLTEAERQEVYYATAELVQQRLNKAASR